MDDDIPQDAPYALDAALLAEIEREFAELTAEIEKINALPALGAPEKAAMIESLRTSWRSRHEGKAERPEWRKTVDAAVDDAVDSVLKDSIEVDVDGNLSFNLRPEALGPHGQPLMNAAAVALRAKLSEILPGVDLGSTEDKDPGKLLSDTLMTAMQAFLGKGLENVVSQFAAKGTHAFAFKSPLKIRPLTPSRSPAPSVPEEQTPVDATSPAPSKPVGSQIGPPMGEDVAPEIQAPPETAKAPVQPKKVEPKRAAGPAAAPKKAVVETADAPTPAGPDMGRPTTKGADPDAIRVKIDIAGLFGALMNPKPVAKKTTKRVRTRPKKPGPKKP